ncbi:MAG: hypothetical protein J5846_07020 [Desulfovibrio sp.]|nr:hypothetical protein [Desulfovibrio sp.]
MFKKTFLAIAFMVYTCGWALADQAKTTFSVTNKSGADICEIYLAPKDADNWGDDLIENLSECLHPGNSVELRLPKDWSQNTTWEMRLVFPENEEASFTADLQLKPGKKANLYKASAEFPGDNIAWSELPQLGNLREASEYFRQCAEKMQPSIPLVFTNGFLPDAGDLVRGTSVTAWSVNTLEQDGSNTRQIYDVTYYAGARVAFAYLHDDTSALSSEEMKLYREAVSILKKIMAQPTDLQKEYLIHDIVLNRARYEMVDFSGLKGNEIPRGKSALGVLLDHKAN